ncbi:phosphatase PAP2 family protein [Kineosporia sp. R_H_3]|uniref:phosphatase PAP2 family protein n=1 Tax=Kineosporia sp. R_H_3 TaxID=1961848 RepID=UPI000B4C1667|nr:phosphatase PAP2 family protein [Kineosporia sp. R_H_3]
MPQLKPSWQLSLTTALVLLAVLLVCRLVRNRWTDVVAAFAQQFAVVMALLALWQRVGGLVHTRKDGAMERGRAVYALQGRLHLPDEVTLQAAVLPHPQVVWFFDTYYAYAHLNGMALFLVWLWWRHREWFARVRTSVVLLTLTCLLVQIVPVAPPRLLPALGFVDTAMVNGRSVYGTFDAGLANQLSAMPSVHVGWAVVVGWYVWWASPSRWRFVGPLHTVLTVLAVTLTANHWWLDGIVATGIFALVVPVGAVLHRLAALVQEKARRTDDDVAASARETAPVQA